MKKRLMAVLLCVCMAAVLLTPYASVLTADGALRLGIAGAENGQEMIETPSTLTEGAGDDEPVGEPEEENEVPEADAPAVPEATATAKPEETKAEQPAQPEKAPEYTLDSNGAVYKDGKTLRGEGQDCVVKASYSVALAYSDPTDRGEAKTYAAGDRVRVYDEIKYEDCEGIEQKWSVVLDGRDFYFVKSEALEAAPAVEDEQAEESDAKAGPMKVINPGTTVVATYEFYNGETLVSSQNIKDKEMLKEPETPTVAEGQAFDGWYTAAEGGEQFTSFGTALTVTKKETIKLYARFRTAYHINFYTPDGKILKFTEEVSDHEAHDFSDLSYEVGTNIKVTGWAAEKSGTKNISNAIKVLEGQTSISVYAIETEGYWVVFDTQGGTSVAPVFKAAGEKLNLNIVTAPNRTGYTFGGWYDNADCTGNAVTEVSSAMTLYAKWTAQTANLTVVFWYENADDDEYSYKASTTVTATTGKEVGGGDYLNERFDGRDDIHFTVDTDNVETVTVAGDGSSKLNVYFKRNQYTLTFTDGKTKLSCKKSEHTHGNGCYKWNWSKWEYELTCKKEEHTHTEGCYSSGVVKTITAKYQADIHSNFPIKEGNDTIWWTVPRGCQSFKPGTQLGSIDRMPGENITFTKDGTQSGGTLWYYVETLNGEKGDYFHNGKQFKLYKKITTRTDGRLTYTEEFHDIAGFTQWWSDPAFDKMEKGGKTDGINTDNYLCYTRNSYTLKFFNHNAELTDKQATVQYEAPLKSYADAVIPADPFDEKGLYKFEGWYFDQYFQNKVDETSTMPAADVMLYAKWVPTSYTVSFNLGYENAPTAPESQTVPAKGKATQPEEPKRDGFKFLGWYEGDEPFSFETEILKDTTLTAKWFSENTFTVVYDANKGTGKAPTDDTRYADGAGATVLGKGEMIAPEGKFFLGWATDKTATAAECLPGGTMTIDASKAVDGKITLYAVWGEKPATTTLTYNANYEGANPPTVSHTENGSAELPNNAQVTLYGADTFTRQGYELIGWNTDQTAANAGTVKYACNTDVIVDTDITAGPNILYAVWKQSTTTVTVKKVVTGNFGDKTKEFEFQYSADEGTTWIDFNLANDGIKSIESVQIGSTLLIREKKVDHYTVTATCGTVVEDPTNTSYWRITAMNIVDKQEIVVTNNSTIIPDTGVILDSLPYVLILAVVALGAAGVVIRRRRSREDD